MYQLKHQCMIILFTLIHEDHWGVNQLLSTARAHLLSCHWTSSHMYIKGYSVVAEGITHHFMDITLNRLCYIYLIGQRRMRRVASLSCVLSELGHYAIMAWPLQKFFDRPQAACWFLKRHQSRSPPGLYAGRRLLYTPPLLGAQDVIRGGRRS